MSDLRERIEQAIDAQRGDLGSRTTEGIADAVLTVFRDWLNERRAQVRHEIETTDDPYGVQPARLRLLADLVADLDAEPTP